MKTKHMFVPVDWFNDNDLMEEIYEDNGLTTDGAKEAYRVLCGKYDAALEKFFMGDAEEFRRLNKSMEFLLTYPDMYEEAE